MATIPAGTKFLGVDSSLTDLTEKKGTRLDNKTEYFSLEDLAATVGVGSEGPQGIQGPAGPPGPVGPAGLNWQGAWDTDSSYAVDDAVGFNGASWFCISEVTGTGNANPEEDTVSWALLAAQGAVGPQGPQGPTGPQGPAGTAEPYTQGIGVATSSTSDANNVLLYNQNIVTPSSNFQNVRLPQNAPIGTEIIVRHNTSAPVGKVLYVRPFLLGNTISALNNVNSNQDRYILTENDNVKFISRGNDFWLVEFITYSNVSFNNFTTGSRGMTINETYYEFESTELSQAALDAFPYSTYVVGAKVYRPNITGGGIAYIKVEPAEVFNNTIIIPSIWVSTPITLVV